MDKINELSLGRKLVLGAGVLLLIDTFLDWQQVSTVLGGIGQSAWHGFWGVLLGLLTIALVAWVAARAFGVELPEGIPEGLISLVLGAVILLFAVIKVISDSYVHWPAYIGIVLAAVVTYGAWLVYKDSGDAFPAMPSTSGKTSSTTEAPPAAPATPDPPPADAAPAETPPEQPSA